MRAKQLAVAAVLGIGVLSSSAPTAVLELEVTYTVGGVDFGPICGMPILPTDVVFNVSFVGNRFSDNVVATDEAVVTALIQFGDATWTEADVEFFEVNYENGVALELNWQMFPIDTAQVLCQKFKSVGLSFASVSADSFPSRSMIFNGGRASPTSTRSPFGRGSANVNVRAG